MYKIYHEIIEGAFEALELCQDNLGEDAVDHTIAQCYEDIGKAYFKCERYYDALKYHKNALACRQECYGQHSDFVPDVSKSHSYIGLTLVELLHTQEAVKHFCTAIEILKSTYGENALHEDIARVYNFLALALRRQFHYQEAMDYHTQAMATFKNIHGQEDHADIALTHMYIGELQMAQGQHTQALQQHKRAIYVYRHIFAHFFLTKPSDMPMEDYMHAFIGKGRVLEKEGHFDEAISTYNYGLELLRRYHGHQEPHEDYMYAQFFDREGIVHTTLGDFPKAKREFESALAIKNEFFDDENNHISLAKTYKHIGDLLVKKFEWTEAEKYYEDAMMIYEQFHESEPNGNHPHIIKCQISLAKVQILQGRHQNGLEIYKKALSLFKDFYGEEAIHPDISHTLSLIAGLYCKMGKYDFAHTANYQSLQMNKSIHTGNLSHLSIAENYSGYGDAFFGQGEYSQAIIYYIKALTIHDTVMHAGHKVQDVVDLHNNIGKAYNHQQKFQEALTSHVDAITIAKAIYDEKFDDNHPETGICHKYIGDVYTECGVYERAHHYYNNANMQYDRYYKVHLSDMRHPNKASILQSMGCAYYKEGEIEKALEKFNAANYLLKFTFNMEAHPLKSEITKQIGDAYFEKGEYEKAMNFYVDSRSLRETCYGVDSNHPCLAESSFHAGKAYSALGKYQHAVVYHLKALTIREAVHEGMKHSDLVSSYTGLANAFMGQNRHEEAQEYFEKALEMNKDIHGGDESESVEVAASLSALGNLFNAKREYTTALDYHIKALNTYIAKEYEEEMEACYNNLGITYINISNFEFALQAHTLAYNIRQEKYDEAVERATSQRGKQSKKSTQPKVDECKRNHYPALAISHYLIGNVHYADAANIFNAEIDAENRLQKYEQSMENYKTALDMLLFLHGDDGNHTDIANLHTNIGLILQQEAALSEAEGGPSDLYDSALCEHSKSLGMRRILHGENANHPDIAENYKNIATVYRLQGDHKQALLQLGTSLRMLEAICGEEADDARIADVYESIGTTYYDSEDYDNALCFYLKARDIRVELYGEFQKCNMELAAIYKNLANVYQRVGKQSNHKRYIALVQQIVQPEEGGDTRGCTVM